jgi:8-oxo-dGTP diphosphatase
VIALVPASYVLLRRTEDGVERVLLQLRRGTGYMDGHWALSAAGHVEAGEDAVSAAVREAAEELGLVLDPKDLVPLCAMHRAAGRTEPGDQRVDFFFACRRWAGEPRRQEADKAAELRWFDLAALPDPVVPHELFVLERLRDGGLPPVVALGF